MQERTRDRLHPERVEGPGSGFFDGSGDVLGTVVVTHGIYRTELPIGQMSVEQVRSRFRDRLDIHPSATAVVDGAPADENTMLRAGQTLTFVRPSGEKGR